MAPSTREFGDASSTLHVCTELFRRALFTPLLFVLTFSALQLPSFLEDAAESFEIVEGARKAFSKVEIASLEAPF